MKGFVIMGHRGVGTGKLENSLASFQTAMDMGVEYIELDVRKTRDGELIVMHDPKINRVAKGKGIVAKMALEALRKIRLKHGEPIPTLEEVILQTKGKCMLNIEVKSKGCEKELIALLKKHKLVRSTIVCSFYADVLKQIRKLHKKVRTCFLTRALTEKTIELARDLDCYAIHPQMKRKMSPAMFVYAHHLGLKVYVWTVNNPKDMLRMLNLGADGIITDVPGKMCHERRCVRKKREKRTVKYFFAKPGEYDF